MLPLLIVKRTLVALFGLASLVLRKNRIFLSCVGEDRPAQNLYDLLAVNRKSIDKVKSFAARTDSAGAGFKLVFQFQDKKGEVISYIKVGDSVHRGIFLHNEKNILQSLETHRDVVLSPKVIGYKEHETFTDRKPELNVPTIAKQLNTMKFYFSDYSKTKFFNISLKDPEESFKEILNFIVK